MINELVDLLVPFSVILLTLLALHQFLLTRFGAQCVYLLWLAVPLSIVGYYLPISVLHEGAVMNSQVEHFIVNSASVIKTSASFDWLKSVWILGACGFIGYWLVNHIQLNQLLNRKLTLKPYKIDPSLIEMPNHLPVYSSAHAFSPMLVGLFKPKIIVPEDFAVLYNQEQQSLILEHEICHFDRNDIYWNLLAFVLVALFWFHPLVWLAYFRFRRDQELSCDQVVLARKQLNSRINYSKALLVSAESTPPIAFAQLTFKQYGDKDIMFERIKHIKTQVKTTKLGVALVSILSVSVLSSMSYAGGLGVNKAATAKDVDKAIMPVIRIEPEYPRSAVQQNLSGAVLLKFDIESDGRTSNISVVKSKPEGVFDQSAVDALSEWEYKSHDYHVITDNYVQLDFVLGPEADKVHLVEAIKVSH